MTTLGAQKKRLVLVTEGDAHMMEYFIKNGVYPGALILTPSKFKEIVPYLTSNDDVLIVVKGLTDFSLAEVYMLIDDLADSEDKLYNATVLSNVDLGVTALPYYFYEGDLFYGAVRKVRMGKYSPYITNETESEQPSNKKSKKDKKVKQQQKIIDNKTINPVMSRYKVYNKLDTKLMIYGSEKSNTIEVDSSDDYLKDKIIIIDAFSKPNN